MKHKMKAVICTRYGPPEVLQITNIDKPSPKDNEVLIKILATTVNSGDSRVRGRRVPKGYGLLVRFILGWNGPRQPILGTELAGVIESVGKNVTKFKVGDQVFAFTDLSMGSHAQYKCMPENGLVTHKPKNLKLEEAAALSFGGTTALCYLKRAKLKKGESILINGASGCVGIAAVQLARHFGAKVTAVCSGRNAKLVRSLGAQKVIDYTKEDFTNGETYDIIMDLVGNAPYSRSKGSLKPGGRLLLVVAAVPDMLLAPWVAATTDKKIIAGPVKTQPDDLRLLAKLAEAAKIKPVIDRRYPFAQIVKAHQYVDTGRKRGSVVITSVAKI